VRYYLLIYTDDDDYGGYCGCTNNNNNSSPARWSIHRLGKIIVWVVVKVFVVIVGGVDEEVVWASRSNCCIVPEDVADCWAPD
jgi:hypothetical protein